MREQRHMRTSIFGTPYKKPKSKNPKSEEERRREENSLVIKNMYTGGDDDCA